MKKALLRYYALACAIFAVSTSLLYLSGEVLFKTTPFATTIIKAIIDGFLFFASYRVQQEWVFKERGIN